ncbi:ricin-type beta-trefoil lectin domain protein (plasmid) [Streptomyces sp. P8-A8]|uniref:ricin-type beta-trefoil lectin domain protein n=1 Tax=Streptomyces sp. P8-A8 TaxID=3029759 RepID=UPI0036D88902
MSRTHQRRWRAAVTAVAVALIAGTATAAQADDQYGPVRLVNKATGRCLQMEADSLAHATDCTDHDGQRLMLQRKMSPGGGFDSAKFLWGGECLAADGGDTLSAGRCDDVRDETDWSVDNRSTQFENLQLSNTAYQNSCLTDLKSENHVTLEECDDGDSTQRWDVRPF